MSLAIAVTGSKENPSAFHAQGNAGLVLRRANLQASVRAWEIAVMIERTTLTIEPVLRPTAEARALIGEFESEGTSE
ncbi:MAG TPA: hypothetical protein VLX09_22350 [Stellaceae bacterium]|nr:hypothetical protein [Stellaceae bacterium]